MPKLIISYRRSDSKDIAGRIRDRLVAHYGDRPGAVYMDIDDIPPGTDFRKHINAALSEGDILLPIIGPKWLGPLKGRRFRISEATDPVRVEIETALERKLTIVPVLVNDAHMPPAAQLPDSIKELAYRNAVNVDGGQDFHLHMNRLISGLDKLRPPAPQVPGASLWRKYWRQIATGCGIAAVFATVLLVVYRSPSREPEIVHLKKSDPPIGGPLIPVQTDRLWPAPKDRGYWIADNSLFYLEPLGSAREFIFAEPSEEMVKLGARPGDLIFEGRKDGDRYEGKAYHYLGTCRDRRVVYEVSGPIIQDLTVALTGNVPRIDLATCKQARAVDDQLLFDAKTTVFKFKERR
jgi:hypothetical protein